MRLRLFLPSVLLIAVAIGWSAFWYYAAHEAGRQLDLLTGDQGAGRPRVTCLDRSLGGYPFRLELRCAAATIEVSTAQGPLAVKAGGLAAVVQLPVPTHVIFELASPVTIGSSPESPEIALSFKVLRGSVHGEGTRFERASLQVVEPVLGLPQDPGSFADGAHADVFDLHVRPSEGGNAGAFDLLAKATAVELPAVDSPLAKAPTDLELQLAVTELDKLAGGEPGDALRAFAEAGGRVHLALLRADQGDITAEAKGDVSLETSGRPSGSVALTVANAGKLVSQLSASGVPGLYAALALGRPTTLGDKPASSYALRLDDGRVLFGSLVVGRLAPLF